MSEYEETLSAYEKSLIDRIDAQAKEIEALRLAMMGGEDAPGYAMSLSMEEVITSFKRHQSDLRQYEEAQAQEITELRAAVAAAREQVLEDAAKAGEEAWPRAHTYASENADYYRGQDYAVSRVIKAIRKLKEA